MALECSLRSPLKMQAEPSGAGQFPRGDIRAEAPAALLTLLHAWCRAPLHPFWSRLRTMSLAHPADGKCSRRPSSLGSACLLFGRGLRS